MKRHPKPKRVRDPKRPHHEDKDQARPFGDSAKTMRDRLIRIKALLGPARVRAISAWSAGRVAELSRAIEDRGVVLAEPGEVDPDRPLVVMSARLAKGLEFDAVIVAEPAEIAEIEPHGARLLFVALTRAVQHLALAHARPVPEILAQ